MNLYSPSHINLGKNRKVCAVDLDDVLACSTEGWLKFLRTVLHPNFDEKNEFSKFETIDMIKEVRSSKWHTISNGRPNWALFKDNYYNLIETKKFIPYYYYRILKEAYRNSWVKADLVSKMDATESMNIIKEKGYSVIIMTARNEKYLALTVRWLEQHKIPFDGIVFDKKKHIRILENYPTLEFMIEDNRDISNQVAKWGYQVFLVSNIYNEGPIDDKVCRVKYLKEIMSKI
jgi:uncharacterized HAD superfamily protein